MKPMPAMQRVHARARQLGDVGHCSEASGCVEGARGWQWAQQRRAAGLRSVRASERARGGDGDEVE